MDQRSSQSSSTKVERKVVEKNRRNYMKILYSNLYSLLPDQNSKELLCLPDQIDEAINHIKRQESKLQKLKEEKEKLVIGRKRSYNSTFCSTNDFESITKSPKIEIHEIGSTTLEVVLTTGIHNQYMFYEIIRILHHEGADVVHASFSVSGDSMLHVLRAEMGKTMLDFGDARITEKLKRFVNGSTSDVELQQQDCFWDFEIHADTWDI